MFHVKILTTVYENASPPVGKTAQFMNKRVDRRKKTKF